ncbi:hypothetical protein HELRODRAFT_178976 [Helobdella robusta]|uniref:Uncharacterized protein n=1 Tax=Helobdella robusta TaxID=6412 RepID=T1FDZ8_HELRO|nr:hypothetical protein HELRODRAFT_178976 [Helobdella robusta]ESN95793.1 hypothetical protein HELRODRAFT_178976 [Helobdella robusta]
MPSPPPTTTDLMKPSSENSIISTSSIFNLRDLNTNNSQASDDAFIQIKCYSSQHINIQIGMTISFGIILPSLMIAIIILTITWLKLKKQSKKITSLTRQVERDLTYQKITCLADTDDSINPNKTEDSVRPYTSLFFGQSRI